MKGSSRVIMWAILSMAITLTIVLALVLILLFDLYCSLKPPPPTTSASDSTSLRTLLGKGVLNAPRNVLFPYKHNLDLEKQDPIETSSENDEHLVYICNPIYDNSAVGPSGSHTPYETPESSLGFYDDGEDKVSPELAPIKKLKVEACSVSLRDANSIAMSPSESETNSKNGVSTNVSGSPSTSSW